VQYLRTAYNDLTNDIPTSLVFDVEFQLAWATADHAHHWQGRIPQETEDEVRRLLQAAHDRSVLEFGPDSRQAIACRAVLAIVLLSHPDSRVQGIQALTLATSQLFDDPEKRLSLTNVLMSYLRGSTLRLNQNYEEALPHYTSAITELERVLHKQHPAVAWLKGDFAGLLEAHGQSDRAAIVLREALEIIERFAPAHREVIGAQLKLAKYLEAQAGNSAAQAECDQLLQKALVSARRSWGPEHHIPQEIEERIRALVARRKAAMTSE